MNHNKVKPLQTASSQADSSSGGGNSHRFDNSGEAAATRDSKLRASRGEAPPRKGLAGTAKVVPALPSIGKRTLFANDYHHMVSEMDSRREQNDEVKELTFEEDEDQFDSGQSFGARAQGRTYKKNDMKRKIAKARKEVEAEELEEEQREKRKRETKTVVDQAVVEGNGAQKWIETQNIIGDEEQNTTRSLLEEGNIKMLKEAERQKTSNLSKQDVQLYKQQIRQISNAKESISEEHVQKELLKDAQELTSPQQRKKAYLKKHSIKYQIPTLYISDVKIFKKDTDYFLRISKYILPKK